MEQVKVSIIVAVYNIEAYIEPCLQSVMAQTWKNLEMIVVDDGSEDDSGKICDRYEANDQRIIVIHKKNEGLSAARNEGLSRATGKYIYFLDGDDWIEPDLIETVISRLKEDNELVIFRSETIDGEGIRNPFGREFPFDGMEVNDEKTLYSLLTEKILTYQLGWEVWNRLYSRSIIQTQGLRFCDGNEVFAEDMLFFLCYICHVKRILCCSRVLHHYRLREDSVMSRNRGKVRLMQFLQLSRKYYGYLEKKDMRCLTENYCRIHERIMDWHTMDIFARYTKRQLKKPLLELAEDSFSREMAGKLLSRQEETKVLFGRKEAWLKKIYYSFLTNGYFKLFLIRSKLVNIIFKYGE